MINNVYKKNDIVYSAVINGRTVVLNTETGRFYNLDGVGCLVWHLFEKPATLNDVVAGVAKECEVSVAECQSDIADFTKTLLDNNLIVRITEV